jgi:anti-sigma regulatory factor (Ser/Thr protein kinase)
MEELLIEAREIRIHGEMDVLRARKLAVSLAASMGFRDIAQAEIEIAVSELGTNIVKHARAQGVLWIMPYREGQGAGLRIIARNTQPTADQDREPQKSSMTRDDGVSTAGTLGIGISGVRRLMDEFDADIDPLGRLTLTAIKWLIKSNWNRANCSVVSRPKVGESVSGDAYYIHHLSNGFLFAVIDGLGHGPDAKYAADIAVKVIDMNHHKPLDIIIRHCHAALEKTRGAALSLGCLHYPSGRLFHAGIGNVETRIYNGNRMEKPMIYNGTLGVNLPHFTVTVSPFGYGTLVIMNSDGISDKFELDTLDRRREPQEITHLIMSRFGRSHDDATVLAVK